MTSALRNFPATEPAEATGSSRALDELCINTLRPLAMDEVEQAKPGHPGLPLGATYRLRVVDAVSASQPARFILAKSQHPVSPRNRDGTNSSLLGRLSPFCIFRCIFVCGAYIYFMERTPPPGAADVYTVAKQWMWRFQHEGGQLAPIIFSRRVLRNHALRDDWRCHCYGARPIKSG